MVQSEIENYEGKNKCAEKFNDNKSNEDWIAYNKTRK